MSLGSRHCSDCILPGWAAGRSSYWGSPRSFRRLPTQADLFLFGYYGLGDLFVFLFFGLASVAGTYYRAGGFCLHCRMVDDDPAGLIITAILVVNNLRDLENDRKAGKHTLAVILGEQGSKDRIFDLYDCCVSCDSPGCMDGIVPWSSLLALALLAACRSHSQRCPYTEGPPAQCRIWQGQDRSRCCSVFCFGSVCS